MHPSVHEYVGQVLKEKDPLRIAHVPRVLEVGSYDVNGTVRDLFPGCAYVGMDIRAGPGVDVVLDIELAHRAPVPFDLFDVVVSTEMLEHTPRPWRAVAGMAHSLVQGGRLILTTRAPGFGLHDHPSDYYRFTLEAIATLCEDAGLHDIEAEWDWDPQSPGVFATAVRRD